LALNGSFEMKKYFVVISLLTMIILSSCTYYEEEFDRIEDHKLRVIGVTYLPHPEGAPGDTITARVYFAGNTTVNMDNFTFAYNPANTVSTDSIKEMPLTLIEKKSWLPDSFQYSFVISDSVFLKEKISSLAKTVKDSMAQILLQSEDSLFAYLKDLNDDQIELFTERFRKMALSCQTYFTAYSEYGSSLRVMSRYSIRYNSRYQDLANVNNNPDVSWLAVYAVPSMYDNQFDSVHILEPSRWRKNYLFNIQHPESVNMNILIDTGYNYRFAINGSVIGYQNSSGHLFADTLGDTETGLDGEEHRESISYNWFYENSDKINRQFESLLIINDKTNRSAAQFEPPKFIEMKNFKVWVVIKDNIYDNVVCRPTGVSVKGVRGTFEYTDAYMKKAGY
jgi:hypothetical protein